MSDVTCALLVVSPSGKILLVHPTNAGYVESWSLPKGIKDDGELEFEAAARECFEETGLDFRDSARSFVDLGRFSYVKGKDLHLFMHLIDHEIDKKILECTTHFIDRNGNKVVEVDRYETATLDYAARLLNKKQMKILRTQLMNLPQE